MSTTDFSGIVDACLEALTAGDTTVEECLDRHPEHRVELEPLLLAATTMMRAPGLSEREPDPARRAAFMAQIRDTPQQRPRRLGLPRLALGGLFAWPAGAAPRLALASLPMAAALLVAVVLVATQPATSAAASTLTVFAGTTERQAGDRWVAAPDGAHLVEGTRLRTSAEGHALLTFPDGSTAALDPGTEVTLERVGTEGPRVVQLRQASGRIWNDVVPDARDGADYAVHTPDAVVRALGTVFETAIRDGETAVAAAAGTVQVVAGSQRADIVAGEALVARGQQLADRQT
ncbi:MAG: FecR family protein, partial [Dehalococcoidia bacterium]